MNPLRPGRRWLTLAALLTLLYCLGIAFNISPWLRGPVDWRWAYARPGTYTRLWLPALLLLVYGLFAWRLALTSSRYQVTMFIAALMTPALQLALLYMDHPDVRAPLFMRTVSPESGGFFNVGAVVVDIPAFLANFAGQMADYPIHPQRHPPGLPLLFALARAFFDSRSATAATLADTLRPYQCHNLSLMNLPAAVLATAVIQMAVPFLLGAVVWPLGRLADALYDRTTAVYSVLLWPLLPGVALWATRWNQLYALFAILALLFFHHALASRRTWSFFGAGLVVSLASFFSFGNVAIAAFLGAYALAWLWASAEERPSLPRLATGALLFAAGLASIWLVAAFAFDLWLPAVWQTAMGIHLTIGRNYLDWLFFHLYDFFIFLGIPLAVLWFVRLRRQAPGRSAGRDAPLWAFAVALLLLDLSGTSQGEVARVWAFLFPYFLITAVATLPRDRRTFGVIIALLASQLFVANIFLRPVGTALAEPPVAPPAHARPANAPLATWSDGPQLLAAPFPPPAVPGQPVTLTTLWTATESVGRPYTFFVHLLDANGALVTQFDGHPRAGAWPTTCWQPGAVFADHYTVNAPTTPGVYTVQIGFYWLPTGERLPLRNGDDTLPLGRLIVR